MVERFEVLGALPDTDEQHRDAEFLLDRDDGASLGRAVELGQDYARHRQFLGKGLGLTQGILPRVRVEDQPCLEGYPLHPVPKDPEYLAQLLHQVDLRVHPPRRIDDHDVDSLCLRRLDRVERDKLRVWVYGSSNHVEETNRTIHAWALDAYSKGATGVLPWQTIDRDGSALKTADQLGLFIFEKKPGETHRTVHHSMRLKAYRRAQQDIEYLELLRKRRKLTRGELARFIRQYVNLEGSVVKRYGADAGTASYEKLSPDGFTRLREAAAAFIEKSTGEGDMPK